MQKKITGVKACATYALTRRYIMTVFIQVNISKKEIKRSKKKKKNSENTSSAGAYYAWVRISDKTMLKNLVIKTFQILNLPVAKHALLLIKTKKSP